MADTGAEPSDSVYLQLLPRRTSRNAFNASPKCSRRPLINAMTAACWPAEPITTRSEALHGMRTGDTPAIRLPAARISSSRSRIHFPPVARSWLAGPRSL